MLTNCELLAKCLLLLCAALCVAASSLQLTNAAAAQQEQQLARQHLSYASVQRLLRDEHAAASYRGELRAAAPHQLHKRELSLPLQLLNLTQQGLTAYDSEQNYQAPTELITRIDLSRNRLRSLKLRSFAQLQQLDASNNSLTTAPELAAALMQLNLGCNRLSQLPSNFLLQRMPQLKQLNLAHNQLRNISRQAFFNAFALETLLLGHNNITDIDYETFLALPNLQHLDLSHNQLSGSAIRALQGIPDLVSLSIAYNPAVGAAMQEFVASWSLKELDASGTGLCQVPAALAQSVRTLKLAHNWLMAINCGDLDSYPLLQYLDLSHAHIKHVEDDALGRLELLELLLLDHNALQRVPNSLPPALEHLFLQHNQILELQPHSFAGLNNLKTLDLSGNRLLYLPALPLPKLLTLNLQSAGIESVSQSIVHTLPELRDLLLEDNPVKCSDLLAIAEWASPCRSADASPSPSPSQLSVLAAIDLRAQYAQLPSLYAQFGSHCGQSAAADDDPVESMPPTCNQQQQAAAAATTERTMPKVQKSKAAAAAATVTTAMQSTANNIALLTTKTLGPAETTSLVKMPSMPTTTATTATAKRTNNLATQPAAATTAAAAIAVNSMQQVLKTTQATTTIVPARRAMPTATTTATTAAATTKVDEPQTILARINSVQQQKHFDNVANSLLKQTAATATLTDTSGQESSKTLPQQHKHATLQLHIKDRHLIGTPLLMHKGDNLLVDAEQLLLPGTATVADAETLDTSQRKEATDKRQTEAINGDIKAPAKPSKKKPTLSIKQMTYSTKHAATTTTTEQQPQQQQQQHQHSSVNTPNAVQQPLSTFAQLQAYVELRTEASKSAQLLLATRQQPSATLSNTHPGLMLLIACVLVIVLLAGLAHVYRCELPWARGHAPARPHQQQQRQLSEPDDAHSFLQFAGDPARLQSWHHSTRREAPYSSPLHNLQARELQREQQKLQFYSASLADICSSSGSSSSRSSLQSPSHEDSYYIEMAPSSPSGGAAAASAQLSNLPMELLSTAGHTCNSSSSSSSAQMAATELGGSQAPSTLRSKLMAPSSRRLGLW
ncbi:2mit [Drosophila busckii]|uniref:2mit n=1 Tax=Drosophila busckii TaxID=30019 RepID=A0A0M4EK73_DROBS|nr:uncharacterized protein LOC108603722 [Drosophila busckii]ALC47534.1 2mit [Drosophila busckii]